MNHIPVLKYEPKSRFIFWLWIFFTLRSLCLLRSSVYCFWKNLVLQTIYYFTLHWTICHFADEAPLKVYCYRCSNTVFFMNTAKKKKVLNKYIWKKKFFVRNVSSLNPTARASGAGFYDNMDCSLDSGFMKWMFDTAFPYCYPKLFLSFSQWPSDQAFDWFIIQKENSYCGNFSIFS